MAETTFTLGVEIDSKEAAANLQDLQKELKKTAAAAKDVNKGFGESLNALSGKIGDFKDNLSGLSGRGGIGGVVESVSGLTSGMGLAAGALVGITAVAGAATIALIANGAAMAAAADDAAELAEKMGITTTQLATFELIASENGSTVESLVKTYDKLGNSLTEVSDGNIKTENAFRRLGIAQSDLAGKSKEEIAGIVIRNYETLGKTVQATAAVQDILGKSFREQIPAIKAAGAEYAEYEKRIKGTVASKELEEAGARQEKALSDLGLAAKTLRLTMAQEFGGIVTTVAESTTSILKSLNSWLDVMNNTSAAERISIRKDYFSEKTGLPGWMYGLGGSTEEEEKEISRRIKVRTEQNKEAAKVAAATESLRNYRGTSTAGAGRSSGIGGILVDLPEKKEVPRLTEEERNLRNYNDAVKSSITDLNRNIAILGQEGDTVGQKVTTLAYKLFDAGKGVKTFDEALKEARKQQKGFNDLLIASSTKKFNDDVKSINESYAIQLQLAAATNDQDRERIRIRAQLSKDFATQKGGLPTKEQAAALAAELVKVDSIYKSIVETTNTSRFNEQVKATNEDFELQLKLLTATTDQQRQQITLQAQLNSIFKDQKGGPTPEQAAAVAKELEKANAQFGILANQKINNTLKDSLRDLSEQAADLAFEAGNYWNVTEFGLKDTTLALRNLERQIDPEGRGKNITDAQRAQVKAQLDFIETQKLTIETNNRINDSFKSLGGAVSSWALGSKDAIRNVKLELVKLIALQALKIYGGSGNSIADTLIGGFIGGLSGARADGGPVDAGKSYLVGERGPEVVKFKQPGYVIPNNQISVGMSRGNSITLAPQLIIQGGVTGQSELDRAFGQFAEAMAQETQKYYNSQTGSGRRR